jgi:hypothetical protein
MGTLMNSETKPDEAPVRRQCHAHLATLIPGARAGARSRPRARSIALKNPLRALLDPRKTQPSTPGTGAALLDRHPPHLSTGVHKRIAAKPLASSTLVSVTNQLPAASD